MSVFSSSSTPVPLTLFNVNFQITENNRTSAPFTPTTSVLQFVNPQGHAYVNNSNYIFYNNSGDVLSSPPTDPINVYTTGSPPFTGAIPYQAAFGGDFANDFSDVMVSTTPVLLARLYLTDIPKLGTGLTPTAGDSFSVSLVPQNSYYEDGNTAGFTVVKDASHMGLVTITGSPSAVPEPASLLLLVAGGSSLLAWKKRGPRA